MSSSVSVPAEDSGEQLAPLAIDPSQSPIAAAPEPLPAINVVTSTPVPPAPEPAPVAPTPTASGRRYVVQKGDSLFAIAKKHYGSATNARVQGILNANRSVLPSAAALQPGMTLVIP